MRRRLSIRALILTAVLITLLFAGAFALVGLWLYLWLKENNASLGGHYPFIIIIFSSAVIISTLFSIPVTRFFVLPIKSLAKATQKVKNGDFSVRVEERDTSNELQSLVSGFNGMVEELGNIQLLRTDFISNFSHEFKTPINSIKGFANELLVDKNLNEAQKREYLQIIVDESERLADMAANILLLTDLEHTSAPVKEERFSLDEQLRRCMLLLEKQWSAKNIEPDIELEEVYYSSDEDMLSHLWINLISNAIKFSPPGGTVSLRCSNGEDCVTVSVSDQGQGIPADKIDKIFDRFYQVDISHQSEGYGLGLSLCKRIAELCGGDISVKSELGKGSIFTVNLPVEKKSKKQKSNRKSEGK
ncbi:MAG: HAMP domain-containing histidine kinase [Ruminococcaceae bacterium]|nr:HAMP domain-containing histidine kinase [Oscillospiraceae bacterium]